MEDPQNTEMLTFESQKDQSSYIKVIGVGGGGCNAVNNMFKNGINGVDFIVCNTDEKALCTSPVPTKIPLAKLGAGNDPKVGKAAALKKADEIREVLSQNTQMLFITAGMGGGTGTGAAPVIAEIAKSIDLENEAAPKILVVAVVTTPFLFEGNRRRLQAEDGIMELRKHVDSILVINDDKLRSFKNYGITTAFSTADDVIFTAVKGISEIITMNAYINIDFQDVNTVMSNSGTALMGSGEASGENRALEAITAAATSVLLNDNDIKGSKDVLLYIAFNPEHEINMDEMDILTSYLTDRTDNPDCNVIWGFGNDPKIEDDTIKVTLIATGFEQKDHLDLPTRSIPITKLPLEDDSSKPAAPKAETDAPAEIHIVSQEEKKAADLAQSDTTASSQSYVQPGQTQSPYMNSEQPVCTEIEDSAKGAPKHIIMLDENPAEDNVETITEQNEPRFGQDPALIRNESHTEPAAEPVPQRQIPTPEAREMTNPQETVEERMKRIQRLHDLLRNDPNGAQAVEDMTTEQLSGMTIEENVYSSNVNTVRTSLNAWGDMSEMCSINDLPD